MDIDVVVPLFNKSDSIIRCLASIERQSKRPRHVLIVDDGSTDESVIKAREFSEQSRLEISIISQPNSGVSVARNTGIDACESELVALIDADDEWLENHLETIVRLATDFPEADLYCLKHAVAEDGVVYDAPQGVTNFHKGYVENFFKASSKGSLANSSKVAFRPAAFQKIGGFPAGVKVSEDLFVWISFAINGKVACDTTQTTVIIHREPDVKKSSRSTEIPYPLVYFGERKDRIRNHEGLRLYLVRIGLLHVAGSLLESDKRGAKNRASALLQVSVPFGVLGLVLAHVPPKLIVLIKRAKLVNNASKSSASAQAAALRSTERHSDT